ncbi:MAG: hypothetical protein DSY80_06270 [Desulfocapsa sp.]|nr:MAG: hypothetical protein DSY80_06270 [Desulfocapsa sp.]
MKTNADLTIYNRYISSRADVYLRTVVKKVALENQRAVRNRSHGGVISDDKAIVYIPMAHGGDYLSPKDWQALSTKTGNWTLQEGDIIVKGEVADTISSAFTVSDLMAKYDDVLKITAVDTWDAGSSSMHHWQVSAK